ncbi:uncharacterized protein F5147DRAFT_222459 [Suillus discolor]|uniref:Uncharacterized protein n=1 Tax=Suillus discolor TaxID=1912936 RepID=A0A9P7F639_9AGAM|nr:uncharacterized protein F5147DRAFT_222459 [Suillus discolor]KAG2106711.1 hypothetical protein F5147DRAFT_222459 [Suillus discolor]
MDQSLSEVGLQDYYQLLADNGLISHSQASQVPKIPTSPSAPDHPRCPLCSHLLVTCHGCSNVTCDNSHCKGADLVSFVSSCQSCLSTLATAKMCSQLNCFSRTHFTGGVICPDCVSPTDGHIICHCGDSWICGPCATQNQLLDRCGRCPKCQNYFCFFGCKYIGVCADCREVTLCNDCMEEELSESDRKRSFRLRESILTFLVETCEECRSRICIDCYEEQKSRCGSCLSVHCMDCAALYVECPGCEERTCSQKTCVCHEWCPVCRSSNNNFWLPLTYRNKAQFSD